MWQSDCLARRQCVPTCSGDVWVEALSELSDCRKGTTILGVVDRQAVSTIQLVELEQAGKVVSVRMRDKNMTNLSGLLQ